MCIGTHRDNFKDATLLTSYFLSFLNDLWMGRRQYNDFGSTINHISVTYITTSMSKQRQIAIMYAASYRLFKLVHTPE